MAPSSTTKLFGGQSSIGKIFSYAWRSIFKVREVLGRGLFWRVGNGEKVKIWDDHWLPDSPFHPIFSEESGLPREALVKSLINKNIGWWDTNMVQSLFTKAVAA